MNSSEPDKLDPIIVNLYEWQEWRHNQIYQCFVPGESFSLYINGEIWRVGKKQPVHFTVANKFSDKTHLGTVYLPDRFTTIDKDAMADPITMFNRLDTLLKGSQE